MAALLIQRFLLARGIARKPVLVDAPGPDAALQPPDRPAGLCVLPLDPLARERRAGLGRGYGSLSSTTSARPPLRRLRRTEFLPPGLARRDPATAEARAPRLGILGVLASCCLRRAPVPAVGAGAVRDALIWPRRNNNQIRTVRIEGARGTIVDKRGQTRTSSRGRSSPAVGPACRRSSRAAPRSEPCGSGCSAPRPDSASRTAPERPQPEQGHGEDGEREHTEDADAERELRREAVRDLDALVRREELGPSQPPQRRPCACRATQ